MTRLTSFRSFNNVHITGNSISSSSSRSSRCTLKYQYRVLSVHGGSNDTGNTCSTSNLPISFLNDDDDEDNAIQVTRTKFEDYKGEKYYQSVQKEDEIKILQEEVRHLHSQAEYDHALMRASELVERCENHFGKKHPVTASSYNDMAVMHKQIGQFKEAKEKFYEALKVYEEIVGVNHLSYASALHNLGVLEKDQSRLDDELSSLERIQTLESSIVQFESALEIRKTSLGDHHPDTVTTKTNLGGALTTQLVQDLEGQPKKEKGKRQPRMSTQTKKRWFKAELYLREASQSSADNRHGEIEMETPSGSSKPYVTTLSGARTAQNLAVFLKTKGESIVRKRIKVEGVDVGEHFAESKSLYSNALAVRNYFLGPSHPDSISSKYSLAELASFLGDEKGANQLREDIILLLEKDK